MITPRPADVKWFYIILVGVFMISATDELIFNALAQCPREQFLSRFWSKRTRKWYVKVNDQWSNEALQEIALNQALGLVVSKDGAILSAQSTPSLVFSILSKLSLRPGEQVLEIGFGSGWMASLAATIVSEKGSVLGIEIDPKVFQIALENVHRFPKNFDYRLGDLSAVGTRRFDVIFSTSASIASTEVFSYLKNNGRISQAIRIPGGGDRTYIFKFEGGVAMPVFAEYTLSVPSTGELVLGAMSSLKIESSRLRRSQLSLDDKVFGGAERQINFMRLREFLYRVFPEFSLVSVSGVDGGKNNFLTFGIKAESSIAVIGGREIYCSHKSSKAFEILSRGLSEFICMRQEGKELVPVVSRCGQGKLNLQWNELPALPRIISF